MTRIDQAAGGYLGAVLLDDSLMIETMSDGIVALCGRGRDALVGSSVLDLLHPDDLERAVWELQELARTQSPTADGMFRIRLNDRRFGAFAIKASTVTHRGNHKTVLKFSILSPAVRAQEFARETVDTLRLMSKPCELEECLERVHRLAERHMSGIHLAISTIQNGVIRTHRRLANRAFHIEESAIGPLPPHVERALANHTEEPWQAFNRMAEFEQTPDGALFTSVLTDDTDELIGYVEATRPTNTEPDHREWMVHGLVRQVLTTVVHRIRLDEQLKDAADRDPLTGLANRRRLLGDLAACTTIAGTVLLLIDVDRFSWINNNLGHREGDKILVAFGRRLSELCPPDATIARFGGDEFIIWYPGAPPDLDSLDHALRASNIAPRGTSDRRALLRCSIGAITIRSDESAVDAITRADEAMYTAKRSGGDSLHVS